MKKWKLFCAGAIVIASVSMNSMVNAKTYRRAGIFTMSGPMLVNLDGAPPISCTMYIGYRVIEMDPDGHTVFMSVLPTDPSHGHSLDFLSINLSGAGGCSGFVFSGFPMPVSSSGTSFQAPVTVGSPGSPGAPCVGNLTGTFNSGGSMTINSVFVCGSTQRLRLNGTVSGGPTVDEYP